MASKRRYRPRPLILDDAGLTAVLFAVSPSSEAALERTVHEELAASFELLRDLEGFGGRVIFAVDPDPLSADERSLARVRGRTTQAVADLGARLQREIELVLRFER